VRPDERGATNRPLRHGGCHFGVAAFAAKEDQMPDYRPNAPSADLFSPDEYLVLCDWFKADYPRSGQRIDDILDEWRIPEEINGYSRSCAGVAQLVEWEQARWAYLFDTGRMRYLLGVAAIAIAIASAMAAVTVCLVISTSPGEGGRPPGT
jgi:hypothetical protein